MKRRRYGFTLIEVLAAVAIISIVGLALLQIGANNAKMIDYILGRKKTNYDLSLFAHSTIDSTMDKTTVTPEEFLESELVVDSDEFRRHLDGSEYELSYETVSSYDLVQDFLKIDDSDEDLAAFADSIPEIIFMVDRIQLVGETHNARYFRVLTDNPLPDVEEESSDSSASSSTGGDSDSSAESSANSSASSTDSGDSGGSTSSTTSESGSDTPPAVGS